MRVPFSNIQLAKIATFGAVFLGGNVILMNYLISKRFHQSEYFVKASIGVLAHKSLVSYLGEPISFGNPNLGDSTVNFSTEKEASFEVPIKGSNTKGRMKFYAVRSAEDNESSHKPFWKLTSLEVIVDDRPNEKVVLVRS